MIYITLFLAVVAILLAVAMIDSSGNDSKIEQLREWCDEMNEEDEEADDEGVGCL